MGNRKRGGDIAVAPKFLNGIKNLLDLTYSICDESPSHNVTDERKTVNSQHHLS